MADDQTVTSSETTILEEIQRVDKEPEDKTAGGYDFGVKKFEEGLGPYGPEDT